MPTILVADDNSNIQKMVTLAFKEHGIVVVAVGNGEAAVRKLPDVHPDLVLADIFMPVRNGYEVCEFVKGDERFAHIPVILLVGAFDPLDEHEVERVHADGVLKKPFVPPDPLIAMVKSLLEKGPAAPPPPAMAAEMFEPGAAPRVEKTQQFTAEELASAMNQPAPTPEPEPEQFAPQATPLAIDELHAPVAFRDMMDVEEEEETAEEDEEAEPEFEASSVSNLHIADATEAPAAAADEEAAGSHEAAHEEVDHWAGIKDEQKRPEAEQPPIHVEFGASERVELITNETRDALAHIEVRPDPALVSSAHDWVSAPPPVAPRPEAVEAEHEPEADFEAKRIEAETPERIAHEAAREEHAVKSVEDTQELEVPPAAAERPLTTLAQDVHDEAARVMPPPRDVEETKQFMAPAPRRPAAMAAPESPAAAVATDQLIETIAQKVMGQLDTKTLEKLTRELVRPLIEALIRREVDKD